MKANASLPLGAAMAMALIFATPARAQGPLTLSPLAGIGGGAWQCGIDTVAGRPILLQVEGNSLAIHALDNPVGPVAIGRWASPRAPARFFLHRHIAYVISSELDGVDDWLTLVDYSDPAAPKAIARKVFQSLRWALCFNGDYLYLSAGTDGIRVFDIANPAALKDVTGWSNLVFPSDYALQGNRLYATVNGSGFSVYDVANPAQPRKVGEYADAGLSALGRIAVADTLALIDFYNGIRLVSVKDPSKPRLIKEIYFGQDPNHIVMRGGLAYAVCHHTFLSILDIGIPDSAKIIGTQRTGGDAGHIALHGDYLYAAAYIAGMQIVSVADPASPALIRTLPTPYRPGDFRQSGNALFLGADGQGLQIFDLANPAFPRKLASLDTGVTAYWLETFRDEIAVAGGYGPQLKVIDIKDKSAPRVVDSISLAPGRAIQGLGKAGDILYVSTTQGLEAYRAAAGQPLAKVYADSLRVNTYGLEVRGNLALIARGSYGLQFADVSAPANPAYLGRIGNLGPTLDGVTRFAWHGDVVYTQDEGRGMALLDVSDPSSPVKVGSVPETEFPQEFLVWKTHLLVRSNSDANYGLYVFDISDPLRPVRERIIRFRDLAGDFGSMRTVGNRLYLSHSDYGLRIFGLSEEPVSARPGRARAGVPGRMPPAGRFDGHAGGIRKIVDALGRFLAP